MTTQPTTEQRQIEQLTALVTKVMPCLPYHNSKHVLDVAEQAATYARMEGLSTYQAHLLRTAGLLHDIIMVPGSATNEKWSARFAAEYLPTIGYTREDAKEVGRIIQATRMPTHPGDLLEGILCDADVDNLGRDDFLAKGEQVREELGAGCDAVWYQKQIAFLDSHRYYTKSARTRRDAGKHHNRTLVERLMQEEIDRTDSGYYLQERDAQSF